MLSLASPWWLLALPLPWLAWKMRRRERVPVDGSEHNAVTHTRAELLAALDGEATRASYGPVWGIFGLMLLVLALAGPRWPSTETPGPARDIILAVDVSGSMRALDFAESGEPRTRLERVKALVGRFLQKRSGDRVGLIAFADSAHTVAPLTRDLDTVQALLGNLRGGIFGEKTALGSAILLATRRLRANPSTAQSIVLLTDGANTSGATSPETAAELADEYAIKIYAVGVGSNDPVLFPRGPLERPERARVPIDEARLKAIAEITGGRYFRADHSEELQRVLDTIDAMERPAVDAGPRVYRELFILPLLAGLFCLAAQLRRDRVAALP